MDKPSAAKPVPGAGLDAQQPAVSPDGEILFSRWFFRRQIWTLPLAGSGAASGGLRPLFTSTRADSLPRISRDGLHMVFQSDRTGTFEVWMSRMDGSDLRRVTSFGGLPSGSPDISPDNKLIAFDSMVDGQREIFVCDVHGSSLRRVTSHPADDVIPRWSSDGNSLYFSSQRDGTNALYKIEMASGAIERISPGAGLIGQESPDGKMLYFTERDGFATDLFAMPVSGGPIRRVISGIRHRGIAVSNAGVYYIPAGMTNEIRLLDTRTGIDKLVISTSDPTLHYIASDAAGSMLAVVVEGPPPGDLMLIRGLPAH